MASTTRTVDNCPDKASATTNYVYVAPDDPVLSHKFVEIGHFVFNVAGHPTVPPGAVALNSVQRRVLKLSVRDAADVRAYAPPQGLPAAGLMYGEVAYVTDKAAPRELAANDIIDRLLKDFTGQILTAGQQIVFELQGLNLRLTVSSLLVTDANTGESADVRRAALAGATAFIFTNAGQAPIKVTGQKGFATNQLFKSRALSFEALGIGGLDAQFESIFRRAFASRVFPPSILERLGIQHVKGMLLYGPPGTGKTLIARQIGKMLNGKEPKVVNGPEVLSKYVGQAEENIRNLFGEAEAEYRGKGDQSELHIIIFDEIDAICRTRGSVRDGTGTHDTIVNQLLTKIDGVDALNNILLIGMTNRRDMLDEAMLRPGRLEVQIEIGLPDEAGRAQILKIHTSRMATNSFLAPDVDLARLAEATKNFSGAELEGLVKSAASFALNRNVDINDLHKPLDEDNIKVTMADFEAALAEVTPAFGAAIENLEAARRGGVIDYGDAFRHLQSTLRALVQQVQQSARTPLLSVLLEGPAGAGTTALAATAAIESGFPFVKVVSPEAMVGFSEPAKVSAATKVFEDAYKSPLSIVILDDIERLLEYVAIGPRFSNGVLQALLVLVKRQPPEGRRLLVIGTSSAGEVLDSMGLAAAFNVQLHVPALRPPEIAAVLEQQGAFGPQDVPAALAALERYCGRDVPVKKLLLWLEMARQALPGDGGAGAGGGAGKIPLDTWTAVLQDLSS